MRALGVAAGVVVGVLAVVALLNLTVYLEASVPPRDELPQLPSGLEIVNETDGCGSGNCFREFDVVGAPGEAPASILARLPSTEDCSARSLVDRRPLCVGYRMGEEAVRGYVSLGKWWS
ncbi:hypothetical protein [Nocardioides dongkuii]|uniref:hypothetical protein n=1 Tax=Nocardioides dongkuii TaxID=2760089 RepID=UPI0015FBAAFE|nr:hypothetical protein [Nocardioides dongkuii]